MADDAVAHPPCGLRSYAYLRSSVMSDVIETTFTGSKRIGTGSKFSLALVPLEFSLFECWYEHPQLNLRVGFRARWVSESRPRRHEDRIVEGTVSLGIIVVKDELRELISEALEGSGAQADVQALVRDCHELIVAYMRAKNELQGFGDQPHVFEAAARAFGTLTTSVEVGPEALHKVNASQLL
jgi:hypothetical protein